MQEAKLLLIEYLLSLHSSCVKGSIPLELCLVSKSAACCAVIEQVKNHTLNWSNTDVAYCDSSKKWVQAHFNKPRKTVLNVLVIVQHDIGAYWFFCSTHTRKRPPTGRL